MQRVFCIIINLERAFWPYSVLAKLGHFQKVTNGIRDDERSLCMYPYTSTIHLSGAIQTYLIYGNWESKPCK